MADFYRAEKVNDRITAIISFTGEIMYLVNGSERSLLIDTCVGAGNLRDFVEKLTEHCRHRPEGDIHLQAGIQQRVAAAGSAAVRL